MSEQRQFEKVKRNFTEAELREMSEALIQSVGDVKTARTEKSAAMTALGAEVKTAEARVFELQEKLSLGYEVIEVEVVTAYDEPKPGMKRVIRADNGEELRTEPMTPRERQQSFGFSEGPERE